MILFNQHALPAQEILDPHKKDSHLRLHVHAWASIGSPDGYTFSPTSLANPRRLLHNLLKLSPQQAARKITSRLTTHLNSPRQAAIGLATDPSQDRLVLFLHPCSPPRPERICLPPHLVFDCPTKMHNTFLQGMYITLDVSDIFVYALRQKCIDCIKDLYGQHVEGVDLCALSTPERQRLEAEVHELWSLIDWTHAARSPHPTPTPIQETRGQLTRGGASIFGYGHHTKTALLPALQRRLHISRIHEVDPTLIPARRSPWAWDTSPTIRDDEDAEVFVAAGWHHTHAAIGAEALRRGKWAILEKPAVTDEAQLDDLLQALRQQEKSRLLVAFHKRYAPQTSWIREDLSLDKDPISYHAHVHVVRLPPRHWYRWPQSGTRLLSNGCHIIDHFLCLRRWPEITDWSARWGPDQQELVATLTLEDKSWLTLVMTERGSDRLGLREQIMISRGDRTVFMTEDTYLAERDGRVLRRAKLDKMAPYEHMINRMCDIIDADAHGDTPRSLELTHRVLLSMERTLRGDSP